MPFLCFLNKCLFDQLFSHLIPLRWMLPSVFSSLMDITCPRSLSACVSLCVLLGVATWFLFLPVLMHTCYSSPHQRHGYVAVFKPGSSFSTSPVGSVYSSGKHYSQTLSCLLLPCFYADYILRLVETNSAYSRYLLSCGAFIVCLPRLDRQLRQPLKGAPNLFLICFKGVKILLVHGVALGTWF